MTAGELVDEARGFHPTFDPKIHTYKVLLQELRRAEAALFRTLSDVGALAADIVFDAADIANALLGNPLGEGESDFFPAYSQILSALAADDAGVRGVDLNQDERNGGGARLRIRIIGGKLYLTQPASVLDQLTDPFDGVQLSAWTGVKALRVTYVPAPSGATTLLSVMASPDQLRPYLVGSLVSFMCTRNPGMGPEKADIQGRAKAMMDEVVASATKTSGNETGWYVTRLV